MTGSEDEQAPEWLDAAFVAAGHEESLPVRAAMDRVRSRLFDFDIAPTQIDRFELLGVLGRGASGVVHAAYDPKLARKIALKVFPRGTDPGVAARVRREARLAASLNHPNVVKVFGLGESDGRLWVAMELIEGTTLRKLLETVPRRFAELEKVLLPVAVGIDAAHRHGVVHRDIKPENILVGDDGRIAVADFGLAAVNTQSTLDAESTEVSGASGGGTPAYMSPEQLEGGDVGAASDQFSYCVTLFEALVGRRPFSGASRRAMLDDMRRGPRAALASAAVPRHVARVLARGLAFEPSARFSSMSALIAALEQKRTPRRFWALGATVLAVGTAAWLLASPEDEAECRNTASSARRFWDSARPHVRTAYAMAPETFVVDGGPRVLRTIDRYVEGLVDAKLAVCETSSTHVASREVVQARTDCLNAHQAKLERFVGTIVEGAALAKTITAVYELPRIEPCKDVVPESEPLPPALRARVDALASSIDSAAQIYETGMYDEGLTRMRELLGEAEALGHEPTRIKALVVLGTFSFRVGDSVKAREAWEEAYFGAQRYRLDRDSLEVATALIVGFVALGQYEDALAWVRHARSIAHRATDPIAVTKLDLTEAIALQYLGRHQEALNLLTPALNLRRSVLGSDDPRTAAIVETIANVHFDLQNYDVALATYEEILRIKETALGPRHPQLATLHNNIGTALFYLGRNEEAQMSWKRALALRSARFEPVAHAMTLSNLGMNAIVLGSAEEGMSYATKALRFWEEQGLDTSHPEYTGVLEALGEAQLALDQPALARRSFERAIEIGNARLIGFHSFMIGPLVGASRAAWAMGDAEATLRHASRLLEQADPSLLGSREMADALWVMAQARSSLGEREAAKQAAADAITAYREAGHDDLAREVEAWQKKHEAATRSQ